MLSAVYCMLKSALARPPAVCLIIETSGATRPIAHLPTRSLAHTPATRPVTQPTTHATTLRHAPIRALN